MKVLIAHRELQCHTVRPADLDVSITDASEFMAEVIKQHARVAMAWVPEIKYVRTELAEQFIEKLLISELVDTADVEEFEVRLGELTRAVIGSNVWATFDILRNYNGVYIRFNMDYRIYEWENGRGKPTLTESLGIDELLYDVESGIKTLLLPQHCNVLYEDSSINFDGNVMHIYAVNSILIESTKDGIKQTLDRNEVLIYEHGEIEVCTYNEYISRCRDASAKLYTVTC